MPIEHPVWQLRCMKVAHAILSVLLLQSLSTQADKLIGHGPSPSSMCPKLTILHRHSMLVLVLLN
jgi:hypothetical protein